MSRNFGSPSSTVPLCRREPYLTSGAPLSEPDPQQVQVINEGPQAVAMHNGTWGSLPLSANVQPSRTDWLIQGTPPESMDAADPSAKIRGAGSYMELSARFRGLITSWLANSDPSRPVVRLAFAPTLGQGFQTREDALRFLGESVEELSIDSTSVTELQYNVGNQVVVEALSTKRLINILRGWRYQMEQMVTFEMMMGLEAQSQQPSLAPKVKTVHVATLVLDVNTAVADNPVPPAGVSPLAGALFELADSTLDWLGLGGDGR